MGDTTTSLDYFLTTSSQQSGFRRTMGGLQFIGGAIQFYGGVMMAPTVIGTPIAVFLMARGADDMLAGGTTYVTGEYTETLTYRATYAATGSQSAATVVDVGTGLISPAIATGVIIKGARASRLTRLAAVARQVDRLEDVADIARFGRGAAQPVRRTWNIWDNWNPKVRGRAIENLWGRNLPRDFPGIDHMDWGAGVASSYKSINLADNTYQTASKLRSMLRRYVNKLDDFQGARFNGVQVLSQQMKLKVLRVAIPPSTRYLPTKLQLGVLDEMQRLGSRRGIVILFEEVGG